MEEFKLEAESGSLSGDPGIGNNPAPSSIDPTVLGGNGSYVSGEEMAQQIAFADAPGDIDSEFYLYAETMQSVRAEVERIQPDSFYHRLDPGPLCLLRFQESRDRFLRCGK